MTFSSDSDTHIESPKTSSYILFTELSLDELREGKPFDGVASGVFVDMFGRTVELKEEDFPKFVENTRELIEASRTESGELVGLPIDASDHDKGDAAGWIIGVELVGSIIRLVPKWTELGIDSIRKGIRRMFSATLNLREKSILGGTLTNWPATRDTRGKVLLRPIELSDSTLLRIDPEGFIRDSIESVIRNSSSLSDYSLDSIQGNVAVLSKGSASLKIPFSVEGNVVQFSSETSWERSKEDPQPEDLDQGEITVEMTEEKLTEFVTKVVTELQSNPGSSSPSPDSSGKKPDLSDLLESLSGLEMTEDARNLQKDQIKQHFELLRRQAELEYKAEVALLKHQTSAHELSVVLTTGSDEIPRVFPIQAEELQAHLTKLSPEELSFWGSFLKKTAVEGLTEFSELGHNKPLVGTQDLPKEIQSKLDSGELTLDDLKNPILQLGDLQTYNLSRWEK